MGLLASQQEVDARALVGRVGTVRHPIKGDWTGKYLCTGYTIKPEDGSVEFLTVESTDRIVGVGVMVDGALHHRPQMVHPSEVRGRPILIKERPFSIWPRLTPAWFNPDPSDPAA